MSYYPERESHIRDKMKLEIDLSNYATKKELEHATDNDISNLAVKNRFSCFEIWSWQSRY